MERYQAVVQMEGQRGLNRRTFKGNFLSRAVFYHLSEFSSKILGICVTAALDDSGLRQTSDGIA